MNNAGKLEALRYGLIDNAPRDALGHGTLAGLEHPDPETANENHQANNRRS